MKNLYHLATIFFLTMLLSVPAFSFCIMELKANLGFIGGSRYVYSGNEISPYPIMTDWGLDFHFVYPLSKKSGDHFGIGFGANSSAFWASFSEGSYSTYKYLSLYTYWLKIPIVFTYCLIGEQGYMNFDFGIYYSIPLWAMRTVEIRETSVDDVNKNITPELMNSSYGLHFQYTLGVGVDKIYHGGRPYPGITGFGIGAAIDISLSDQLNLPSEDFSGWNFGLLFTWPFFFNI
ncbi:MAG: hypothetical protein A2014_07540 [Spirochaetes bacterium GWF1_49_6]|nr:MAG: hypothetical protein A2014_07540 [Spirochaetes bacterium GWF1_49_6]